MSEADLQSLEERVAAISPHKRVWVVPLLLAIEALGGSAKPIDVEAKVREVVPDDQITDGQWDRIVESKRVRWANHDVKKAGLVGGARGAWELTDEGRAYLDAHRGDAVEVPNMKERDDTATDADCPVETVTVTEFAGYEVPLLEVLAEGLSQLQEVQARLFQKVGDQLLPGDRRPWTTGGEVWSYRTRWALTNLKKAGSAANPARGVWEITEAGRERLTKERDGWKIAPFQSSKASVPALLAAPKPVDEKPKLSWERLGKMLAKGVFRALDLRLRPDLGPKRNLPRNVILYGPPGTGKTFVAKLVARALTGDDEPGPDSAFRIVQFHPSYAYEDFVQGLKPDLEKTELRYVLRAGPFLEICQAAAADPERFYVLIIDEINRGDPARIFGELLYALEYRDESIDLPNGGRLVVPMNLVIIGTMNSVDRSVALVDYALRRRFGFVRLDSDPDVIAVVRGKEPAARLAADLLDGFNGWLIAQLDAEHAIGHSFFLNPAIPLSNAASLDQVWELDVRPLLEEYFFGDRDRLAEAERAWSRCLAEASETTADVEPSGDPAEGA